MGGQFALHSAKGDGTSIVVTVRAVDLADGLSL
jgi:hypothetical protein